MAEFLKAYKRTAVHEGGYANVTGDRGGETYKGIARRFYPGWDGWKIVDASKPLRHNQIINSAKLDELVHSFYKGKYWDALRGDLIDSQILAEFLYDYYVHSGTMAVKKLQEIVGVVVDGVLGPISINAINKSCAITTFSKLKQERINFLTKLSASPSQAKFRTGWLRRVNSYSI